MDKETALKEKQMKLGIKSKKSNQLLKEIFDETGKVIVGMQASLELILIAFLSSGHVLLEGVPGLAKTLLIKTFAEISGLSFKRIQFTPDLLPADILGTQIYEQRTGKFITRKGPLFANVILADEVNRAPSKVQSALLEAMQEKQITLADETYRLALPFMVLATQNPIEHEGTYELPEAQLDRFMIKVVVPYPSKSEEEIIINNYVSPSSPKLKKLLTPQKIQQLQEVVAHTYIDERLVRYIVDIVDATRYPESYGLEKNIIQFGVSPRASIDLAKAAKAYAFIHGEEYVKVDDIKEVASGVLQHRLILSYEAQAREIHASDIITRILESVKVP